MDKLAEMAYHTQIIVVLGGSLAVNMLQANPAGDMTGISEASKKLGSLLQSALPGCDVSFVAVLPQHFDAGAVQTSTGASAVVKMENFPEDILQASFFNIPSFYMPATKAKHGGGHFDQN